MTIEAQPEATSCWQKHHPRRPYTHSEQACDYCCIGCDKPGIGSNQHDPSNNSDKDCALICLPLCIVFDVLCFFPMVFGCYEVHNPN
jgi:hypothetical protein